MRRTLTNTLKIINKGRSKYDKVTLKDDEIKSCKGTRVFPTVDWEDMNVVETLPNTCSLDEFSFEAFEGCIDEVVKNISYNFNVNFTREETQIVKAELVNYNLGKFVANRAWISMVNKGRGYDFFQKLVGLKKAKFVGSYDSTTSRQKVYIYISNKIRK